MTAYAISGSNPQIVVAMGSNIWSTPIMAHAVQMCSVCPPEHAQHTVAVVGCADSVGKISVSSTMFVKRIHGWGSAWDI